MSNVSRKMRRRARHRRVQATVRRQSYGPHWEIFGVDRGTPWSGCKLWEGGQVLGFGLEVWGRGHSTLLSRASRPMILLISPISDRATPIVGILFPNAGIHSVIYARCVSADCRKPANTVVHRSHAAVEGRLFLFWPPMMMVVRRKKK